LEIPLEIKVEETTPPKPISLSTEEKNMPAETTSNKEEDNTQAFPADFPSKKVFVEVCKKYDIVFFESGKTPAMYNLTNLVAFIKKDTYKCEDLFNSNHQDPEMYLRQSLEGRTFLVLKELLEILKIKWETWADENLTYLSKECREIYMTLGKYTKDNKKIGYLGLNRILKIIELQKHKHLKNPVSIFLSVYYPQLYAQLLPEAERKDNFGDLLKILDKRLGIIELISPPSTLPEPAPGVSETPPDLPVFESSIEDLVTMNINLVEEKEDLITQIKNLHSKNIKDRDLVGEH
jgi:hypothetical protein